MQIFVLDYNPIASAHKLQELSPKRANKQIVEAMQLFANLAYHHNTTIPQTKNGTDYKQSHLYHPILDHLKHSDYTVQWLFQMICELKDRYYPKHASLSPYNIACIFELLNRCDNSRPYLLNFAKSQSKKNKEGQPLDFTNLPITEAYELYIKEQTNPRT
jgi:hypothetical protein